jgi:hypothetical protein
MVPTALSRHRSTLGTCVGFSLLTALLLAACTARAPIVTETDHAVGQVEQAAPSGQVLEAALHGRTGAYLTVRDAASRVLIRAADLPGLLYRIVTPPEAGLAAQVTGPAGHPSVRLHPTGGDGPDDLTILLNREVRWDIRVPAGGGEQRLDLRGSHPVRLQLGASGLIDLRLPEPVGTVPVTLSGPVGGVTLSAPRSAPLRLRLRAGAAWATLPGKFRHPLLPGSFWVPRRAFRDRYEVDARAPIAALDVRE